MSKIEPGSDIWILKDIPLDNTYQHTLYWDMNSTGKRNQYEYFSAFSKRVKVFNYQTYQRSNRGKVRVEADADSLYEANYMMFRNSNFGDKIFYAFITAIDYINNNVTEISYEIDVIQTWYFDYNLRTCFIERMHTDSDEVGENIIAEPVNVGEYIYPSEIGKILNTDDMVIIIAIVDTGVGTTGTPVAGSVYGRIYGAATLKAFQPSDISGINDELSSWVTAGKPDAVVSVYLAPAFLITATVPQSGGLVLTSSNVRTTAQDVLLPALDDEWSLGDYTPHNKKMYTYPYNLYEVNTPSGASINVRYEFFKNLQPSFKIGGCVTSPVELTLTPFNYKNDVPQSATWFNTPIFSEAIKLTDYPMCSWTSDTYKAWAAQNAIPTALRLGTSFTTALLGSLVSPIIGSFGVMNILREATSIVQQSYQASIAADNMHGNLSGSSSIAMGYQGFYGARKCVNSSDARSIDSFFDVFGYAIKAIKEPKRKNRRYFTYVKTVGCVIVESTMATCGIPMDDANKICKLHDQGITYWDTSEEPNLVGNYALAVANRPLSELNG